MWSGIREPVPVLRPSSDAQTAKQTMSREIVLVYTKVATRTGGLDRTVLATRRAPGRPAPFPAKLQGVTFRVDEISLVEHDPVGEDCLLDRLVLRPACYVWSR